MCCRKAIRRRVKRALEDAGYRVLSFAPASGHFHIRVENASGRTGLLSTSGTPTDTSHLHRIVLRDADRYIGRGA